MVFYDRISWKIPYVRFEHWGWIFIISLLTGKWFKNSCCRAFWKKEIFCWHCHTGIFAYPMWVAINYNIPLIFWGEPSSEYTAYFDYTQPEEVDEKRFNRYVNLGITADDMFVRLEGTSMKEISNPLNILH